MATEVRRRRGSEAENDAFTGAEGEVTIIIEGGGVPATNVITAVVHDGIEVGGFQLARKTLDNISGVPADQATARTNLDLGSVATIDTGTAIGEVPVNSFAGALGSAAYEAVGIVDQTVPVLLDSVVNPGTGALPIISAENLINIPTTTVDTTSRANSALTTYLTLYQNNLPAQILSDGFMDAYVGSASATVSGDGVYNSGNKTFDDDVGATGFFLDSSTFTAKVTDPAAAHIAILMAGSTTFTARASRDAGTTFTDFTLVNRGTVLDGSVTLLTGTVDISAQPAGSGMQYQIEVPAAKVIQIHGTALFWQTEVFVGI